MVLKSTFLILGGIFLGKYMLFDDAIDGIIDSVFPTQRSILIAIIILIGGGLWMIHKEGHLRMPHFLR